MGVEKVIETKLLLNGLLSLSQLFSDLKLLKINEHMLNFNVPLDLRAFFGIALENLRSELALEVMEVFELAQAKEISRLVREDRKHILFEDCFHVAESLSFSF